MARKRQRSLRMGATAIAAVLSVLLLGSAPTPVAAETPARRSRIAAPPTVGWTVECSFVRQAKDDPIVFPDQPGATHLHDFIANTTTDAYSTHQNLLKGDTTCEASDDTSAYWTPALLFGGEPVEHREGEMDFYYRSRTYPLSAVRPFPPGLKIIAGNGQATAPQSTSVVNWDCEDGGSDDDQNHPVDCGTGYVSADIQFPECWNGTQLDSPNHKSHMAYAAKGRDGRFRCPASHPVPVPRLIFSVEWDVHDGTAISLSSGPYYTLHADFFNAWQPETLEDLVAGCINTGVNCGGLG